MVQPIKRTAEKIHQRMREVADRDYTGRERSALLEALDYRNAKTYLRADAPHTEESWRSTQKLTTKDVADEAEGVLIQAWTSANARRSTIVKKCIAFLRGSLWLIGSKSARDCLDKIESYDDEDFEYFGKPFLVELSEAFDFSWRVFDDDRWLNEVGDEPLNAEAALEDARL